MAKKVKTILKLNLPAGEATPAPPVGPMLGQHGVPIMDFCKQYNARTKDKKGTIIPAVLTVYEDRSFTFVTKLPPVSEYIKKTLGIKKGSAKTGREFVGTLTQQQVSEIAAEKIKDFNTSDPAKAEKIVIGSAKSMGVKVEE